VFDRQVSSSDRLLLAAFLVVCALYCLTPIHSNNFFWHLRNGGDILDSGTIRNTDPFTWTASGREWLQQEWLAEVALALAWRLPGDSGPVILKSLIITASLLLAVMAARRMGATMSGAVFTALVWAVLSHGRWIERPHIFTILFFSLYLYLTARGTGGLARSLLIFIPLQALWTNFHAGFIMGYLLLAVWTARSLMGGRRREALERGTVLFAAVLTSGLHPNGFRSVAYLTEYLSRPLFRETIREWWSPFHPMFQPGHTLSTTAILLTLFLAATWILVAIERKKVGVVTAIALTLLSVATVTTSRNIDLLSLAAVAWTAPLLAGRFRIPRLLPAGLLAAAAAVPFIFGVPREFGPPRPLGTGVDWNIYPTGLADFLLENPALMQARLFNTNEISGYLEYVFGASLPLYMDGRCVLFSERLYAEYLMLASLEDPSIAPVQMDVLDRLDIQMILIDWPRNDGSVGYSAAMSPEWAPVYWDALSIAYVRVSFLEEAGLDGLALEHFDPLVPMELAGLGFGGIPASWLDDLTRTASPPMSSQTPAIVCVALLLREGRKSEAAAMSRELLAEEPIRSGMLLALEGTSPMFMDSRTEVLKAWSLARSGDLTGAAATAADAGETELAGWLGFLDDHSNIHADGCPPPPMVPEGAWDRMLTGGTPPGDLSAARASALLACGLGDAAVDTARSLLGSGVSFSPWALAVSGGVLALSGFGDEAAVLADSALALSRNPCTLTVRGRIAAMAGDLETAVNLCSEALSVSPLLYETLLLRADCLWRLGEIPAAMADYHILHGVGYLPEAMEARFQWGCYFEQGA
jgi:hypothetical protein